MASKEGYSWKQPQLQRSIAEEIKQQPCWREQCSFSSKMQKAEWNKPLPRVNNRRMRSVEMSNSIRWHFKKRSLKNNLPCRKVMKIHKQSSGAASASHVRLVQTFQKLIRLLMKKMYCFGSDKIRYCKVFIPRDIKPSVICMWGLFKGWWLLFFFFGLGGFYGGEGGAALVKIAQNVNAYKICF